MNMVDPIFRLVMAVGVGTPTGLVFLAGAETSLGAGTVVSLGSAFAVAGTIIWAVWHIRGMYDRLESMSKKLDNLPCDERNGGPTYPVCKKRPLN